MLRSLAESDSLQPHVLQPASQAPPPVDFSRQEYWSGLPFPTSGDLSHPGIKPVSLASATAACKLLVAGCGI